MEFNGAMFLLKIGTPLGLGTIRKGNFRGTQEFPTEGCENSFVQLPNGGAGILRKTGWGPRQTMQVDAAAAAASHSKPIYASWESSIGFNIGICREVFHIYYLD